MVVNNLNDQNTGYEGPFDPPIFGTRDGVIIRNEDKAIRAPKVHRELAAAVPA